MRQNYFPLTAASPANQLTDHPLMPANWMDDAQELASIELMDLKLIGANARRARAVFGEPRRQSAKR